MHWAPDVEGVIISYYILRKNSGGMRWFSQPFYYARLVFCRPLHTNRITTVTRFSLEIRSILRRQMAVCLFVIQHRKNSSVPRWMLIWKQKQQTTESEQRLVCWCLCFAFALLKSSLFSPFLFLHFNEFLRSNLVVQVLGILLLISPNSFFVTADCELHWSLFSYHNTPFQDRCY